MKVFYNICHFLHDCSCLSFGEEFLSEYFIKKLPSSHQLKHQIDLVLLLEHVSKTDDVWMLTISEQDLDLLLAVPLAPVDDLDRILNPGSELQQRNFEDFGGGPLILDP